MRIAGSSRLELDNSGVLLRGLREKGKCRKNGGISRNEGLKWLLPVQNDSKRVLEMDPMLSKGNWNERGPTGTVDCRDALTALDSTGTGYSTGMVDTGF